MAGADPARAEAEALQAEVERLREELRSYRQLVSQVIEAEEQARRRIAQLIHDDALQSLLAAHQELLEAAPGRAQVMRAHEVVGGAIGRLREALLSLHPVTLEQGGLDQALGAIARQAERQGGITVTLELDPQAHGGHDELVLGIARELLSNAAKHSGASAVSVALRLEVGEGEGGGEVVLEVADDGKGFEPGRRERALAEGHIGLASVAQRAESAGGSFELAERAGGGTVARTRFPAPG